MQSGSSTAGRRSAACAIRLGWTAVVAALTLACGGAPARPNVVLLVVDTLRADYLGAYGSSRELTPNLDALARESTVFRRAYSPASYTLPSVVGLLTGRFPEAVGIRANVSIFQGVVPTLPVLLLSSGWKTAAVVSNPVLQRRVGLHNGFESYDDVRAYRTGQRTTDAALGVLDEHIASSEEPLFLWVHYQDPHGPYQPPDGFRERYLDEERARPDGQRVLPLGSTHVGDGSIPNYQSIGGRRDVAFYRAGYAGEIRFVDEEIGRLLAGMAERGFSDDTIIVFTADHGEALGEDDFWFAHGETLNDPIVRVPLMVKVPGRPGAVRDDVASLVDVLPTVSGLLGLAPPDDVSGRDLLADGASETGTRVWLTTGRHATVKQEGIVDGGLKLIRPHADPHGSGEAGLVYRVGVGFDDERRANDVPSDTLGKELDRLRQAAGDPVSERVQQIDDETRAQLEALGYSEPADGP